LKTVLSGLYSRALAVERKRKRNRGENSDLEEEKGGAALAIWSDHIGLARFAKGYFEYLWNDARDRISQTRT
jgi:hypothetical protein